MNQILMVLGAPRSGISILTQCLNLLGCKLPEINSQNEAEVISLLFFNQLGIDPLGAGKLPEDWQQLTAATIARERIRILLINQKKENSPLIIASQALCRILPLWMDVLGKLDIKPMFIHCLRHPWEVAQSLASNKNMDVNKANLIWLSHNRDAVSTYRKWPHVLTTFDQLLTDPVSTFQCIQDKLMVTYPNTFERVYPELINIVQPKLRNYNVAYMRKRESKRFERFSNVYDHIYQYCLGINFDNKHIKRNIGQSNCSLERLLNDKKKSTTNTSFQLNDEIIDLLLRYIGQYEEKENRAKAEINQKRGGESDKSPTLFFQLGIGNCKQNKYIFKKIKLPENKWYKIYFKEFGEKLIKDNEIILIPLNTPGTIKISSINLKTATHGDEVFWSAKSARDFENIIIEGDAIRLPDQKNLVLLVTGNKPKIRIITPERTNDFPLEIEVWVKASKNQEILKEKKYHFIENDDFSIINILSDQRIWNNDTFVNIIDVILTTHKNIRHLSQFINPMTKEKIGTVYEECCRVENSRPVYNNIISKVCEDKKIQFKDAVLEYYDDFGLWISMNEILIHQEYFFNNKSKNPKILDCGANIGLAIYYFKHFYPEAIITCFEPVPKFAEIIQRNIVRNNWKNVEILPYAIDGVDGLSEFYVSKNMSLAGTLTDRRKNAGDKLEKITVERRRLSHYLKEPIDYLKIDIEGSEDLVFEESAALLGNVQYIFCEYHHGLGMPTSRLKKILNILDKSNFDYQVSKSVSYEETTGFHPMKYVGSPYSAVVFAKNKDWSAGQIKAENYLQKKYKGKR